ncbi:carbohydrate porin [Sphingomonas oleivorans]|nr:carbohydrate porin [Sphingomonas oleivorans]
MTGSNPLADEHLLGDWAGIRTGLQDMGISLSAQYLLHGVYNLNGGTDSGFRQAGQASLGATFDLDRMIGVKKAVIQLLILNRNGDNLSTDKRLFLLQPAQGIYGRGEVWRLTQFWYRQTIGKVEYKIGRVSLSEDFATAPCIFENGTFCGTAPGNILGYYWYNSPVSEWGARVRLYDGRKGYFQLGLYEVNPSNLRDDKGFNLSFKGCTGVMIPIEKAWAVRLGGDPRRAGLYKIGAWYDTSRATDLVRDVDGGMAALSGRPLEKKRGRYGAYAAFRQQIVAPDAEGAGGFNMFLNAVQGDRRTAPLLNKFAVGAFYSGLIPGRPTDEIGLAIGRTRSNGRLARMHAAWNEMARDNVPIRRSEYAAELDYIIYPLPGLTLRPNLQLVVHPAGRSDRKSIVIAGFSALTSF